MNGNLHGTRARRRNLVIRLPLEQHSHGKTERAECWQTALTDDEETENQTHGLQIDLFDQAMQMSATEAELLMLLSLLFLSVRF